LGGGAARGAGFGLGFAGEVSTAALALGGSATLALGGGATLADGGTTALAVVVGSGIFAGGDCCEIAFS
jgi:hypothetical protein